jgi:hypothetical protein
MLLAPLYPLNTQTRHGFLEMEERDKIHIQVKEICYTNKSTSFATQFPLGVAYVYCGHLPSYIWHTANVNPFIWDLQNKSLLFPLLQTFKQTQFRVSFNKQYFSWILNRIDTHSH